MVFWIYLLNSMPRVPDQNHRYLMVEHGQAIYFPFSPGVIFFGLLVPPLLALFILNRCGKRVL